MRKKLVRGIALAVILTFAGCGGNNDNAKSDSANQIKTEDVAQSNDESEKIEYTSSSFKGINYKIPSTWRSVLSDNGQNMYYYPTENSQPMLMISYYEIEITDLESNLDSVMDGMKNTEGTSAFSVSNGTLNGKSSRNFNYTLTLENTTTKVSGYTFPALSGVAHIMWGQEEKDSDDYTSIFNEVLNSLQYEVKPPSTTVAPTAEPTPSVEPEPSATPSTEEITMSQRNALSKAHDYLDYTAFSYSGLIGQLEYEGFSTEDSTYAVDNCGADWNEQAAKKAQDYLDYSSFSRTGLIEQLEYEGFTAEQAEYGVSAVGY